MTDAANLIVMLTHNDHTVENAYEVFSKCKNSKAELWGFKEAGIPIDEMKCLFSEMKRCGKTTVLEVVAYTERECMNSARLAVECECDILMGTLFYDSVNAFCKTNGLKYMPFVGNVSNRPSVLCGEIEDIISQAKEYLNMGVYGFDLLGYRYVGDAKELIKRFVAEIEAPVCIAGSVNSYERLDEIKGVAPWGFTIGGAFFENKFGNTFTEQINSVFDYITQEEKRV